MHHVFIVHGSQQAFVELQEDGRQVCNQTSAQAKWLFDGSSCTCAKTRAASTPKGCDGIEREGKMEMP
jgi:hypothetical protein